ncbi:hypothetical protein EV127DRAFT_409453 [Xylaria flabelliformis]|nr:hypothetical protein EV127DRAFT_409453 [Xylaria flabelliformis]
MGYRRDTANIARSGHLAIVISMIVLMVVLLIVWALMGYQVYHLRQQRLADLESGVVVGSIAGDIPLDDVLKGARCSQAQSTRAYRPLRISLSVARKGRKGSFNTSSRSCAQRDSSGVEKNVPFGTYLKISGYSRPGKPTPESC